MITIDSTKHYQSIDGFGISEAFGQAKLLHSLAPTLQRQVLDDLFNTSNGAGIDILRNIIPSTANISIEPISPRNAKIAPLYVWNDDEGQVWLSKLLEREYDIHQFYADAWSAPGFMKTNGSETNGGQLCGSPGTACRTGDWRQAYANYLTHYLQDYQGAGITIPYVGFTNEPDLTVSYPSMQMSPQQTEDFVKILGPTLLHADLSTSIVCCDTETWTAARDSYIPAIANDPVASSYVAVYSGHGYIHPPKSPLTLNGKKRSWETEWSTFHAWDNRWDHSATDSGFTWAQHIHTALTAGNVNAFFYWWGAADDAKDQSLIRIHDNSIEVSKRLWAFANYSRFIRPGAIRIGATTSDPALQVTAFRNTDQSLVIVALNTAAQAMTVPIALPKMGRHSVVAYVTDTTNDMSQQDALPITHDIFSTTLPARSLITYTIPAH